MAVRHTFLGFFEKYFDTELRTELGTLEASSELELGKLRIRALLLPHVGVLEYTSDHLGFTVGRGTIRDRYARSLCMVVSGTMRYSTPAGSAVAGPGDVLLLGLHDSVRYPATVECSDGFRGLQLLAASPLPEESTRKASERPQPPFTSPLGGSFIAFLDALIGSQDLMADRPMPTIVAVVEDMIFDMFRTLELQQAAMETIKTLRHMDPFASALELIRVRSHRFDLDPHTIAFQLNLSVGHLHRLFAEHDRSVAEEIRLQRTALALEILNDPRLGKVHVDEVARSAGFSTTRSMQRAIYRATGKTPTAVRRDATQRH